MNNIKASDLNKVSFRKNCEEQGIAYVEVNYDGFGDSGQINDICYYRSVDETMSSPSIKTEYFRSEHRRIDENWEEILVAVEGNFSDLIEEMVYDFLETKFPGWEINEGSYGMITFKADGTGAFEHTIKIEETHTGEFSEE